MAEELSSRVRARISDTNAALLGVRARSSGLTKSRIIDNALCASFTFEHDDARDARIIERLDMMTRHNHRHARDLNLQSEAFSMFLHFFFTMSPQIPAADSEARAARGVGLMNQYIDSLGEKMRGGGKTFKHALEDVLVSDEDFFKLDELSLLKALQHKKLTSPKKERANV